MTSRGALYARLAFQLWKDLIRTPFDLLFLVMGTEANRENTGSRIVERFYVFHRVLG
jgi:hypothetical protein